MELYTHADSGYGYEVGLVWSFLAIDCEEQQVDLMLDEQHQDAYLAVNPRGEVPALEDNGRVLRDSAAILVYLAAKHGPLPWWSADPGEQGDMTEWLAFAASWIQYGVFTARALVSFGIPANGLPADFPHEAASARLRAQRSLEILDAHLDDQSWLACNRPTIADVAVFPYVALAPMGEIELAPYPAVEAWIARFKKLPGFISMPGLEDPDYRRAR